MPLHDGPRDGEDSHQERGDRQLRVLRYGQHFQFIEASTGLKNLRTVT